VKYAWIASNKARWPITLVCDVLGVSASGYFEHLRRKTLDKPGKPGSNKRMSDERLLIEIRAIHAEVKREYGWPKMWKELVARGHRVGKERVRRLMQKHGLIFHSDRGSQYCGHEFQDTLKAYKMQSSMSRKGNCWDNAPTESLWGRLKVGRLYG
jgi:transposase InsO family protein